MASFATPADVTACFRNLDITSSNAAVTSVQIQKWLDSAHNFVIGAIGTLYALPITKDSNPLSAAIIAEIEAFKVAGIVDDVLNTYAEADKKPQWEKRAMMTLKQYVPDKDPKTGYQPVPSVKLPDAQYVGTGEQKGRVSVQNTTSGPIFKKGQDNW